MTPQARKDQLLVQEVADELVVYDQERHQAHSLNRTAALVWRHCDGKTTIAALTSLVARELNLPADEDVVWLALDRLDKAKLLQERLIRPTDGIRISRRQVVRKLGLAASLALLLPIVTSNSPANADHLGNPSAGGGGGGMPPQPCIDINPPAQSKTVNRNDIAARSRAIDELTDRVSANCTCMPNNCIKKCEYLATVSSITEENVGTDQIKITVAVNCNCKCPK